MKLNIDEGKYVSKEGDAYYSIEVDGRQTFGDYPLWVDMINWANEQYGDDYKRWNVSTKRFFFRDKEDFSSLIHCGIWF